METLKMVKRNKIPKILVLLFQSITSNPGKTFIKISPNEALATAPT